FSSSCLT
ncbi:hypothetical protein D039_0756B, partial [Vibrio parahaemolyticus EKP-028]